MQQPVRYYITKSGEEPTVRSVKVARGDQEQDPHADLEKNAPIEQTPRRRQAPEQRLDVKRLVTEAIRRRSAES